jgi:hypothetical protein
MIIYRSNRAASLECQNEMKDKSAISPQVEEILSRCSDNAERIRIARRLEAIASELWERVFGEQKPGPTMPPFPRN